jgi:hypothetical protein
VNEEYAKRPKNYFFADSFTPEENLAEHFEIEVDESIFALAKTHNPFFLPDLDALRFIDAGDTLTLYCGEESLHFETITDIDRSSSEESEDLPCKIDTKYKIIVSYSKESNLPAPTDESRSVSALLNKMAAIEAAIKLPQTIPMNKARKRDSPQYRKRQTLNKKLLKKAKNKSEMNADFLIF